MADRLTRIAILKEDRCKPKKCRQECKKSCPVVKTGCFNEARITEEEPLNKVKRCNKPKRSRQRSWEKWSTLGEPSGRWDYYVKYDALTTTTPIEEIAETVWGDEFSEDEATQGKSLLEAISPYMIQSWGHQSIHQRNKIHNHSIDETISLVILTEKAKHSAKDMEDYTSLQQLEKLFAKLSPSLSKKIEESFKAKKNYGIRKSRTYKGKSHNSHVKPFKRKYKDDRGRVKKCKCFICGKEWHFAKDCRSKQGNIARSAVYQELDLDDNWDIVSTDFDDSSVYSISEREGDTHQSISVMVQDTHVEQVVFMTIKESDESDTCALCAKNYLRTVNVKGKQPQKPEEENDFSSNEKEELWQSKESLLIRDLTHALKIIEQLKAEQEQKDEKIRELKSQLQKEKEKHMQDQEEFPPLRNSQTSRPCIETEIHYSGNAAASPKVRKITNQLYNVKVEFEIPSCPMFATTAIIDTRASTCCINKKVILEDALEPLTQTVFFNGLNSRQQATHSIKQGSFLIEENKFKIPLIYAFDMRDSNGIEMLIGANFLRSMKGGIRIEGDEIIIYKKATRIKTSNQTKIAKIAELEVGQEEFLEINESVYFNQKGSKAFLEQFKPVINRLKHQGCIREPLKHWKKNGELCKPDIINPEDRPLKHVTPAMEDSFRKHVDSLLKIGAIRPSKSSHRTMAIIVNSGTIDPVIRREVKRKERMVFNYKSLNDNTYKDQYSLPDIDTIIKRIGGAKIFSKFDLKSGFYQVAMDEVNLRYSKKRWINASKEHNHSSQYILVFSKNEKEHAKHSERMLKIFKDNGLVLSPTKMKIAVSTVDFLGGETKQLAASLYSVEEDLQSPFAFQKNMKITCEEVMKISNHFQESSQKLSSHMKNQEHYTCITDSKPIKHQSEWINLMHEEQSPKTLKFQQQKKQSESCEVYRQSYNVRPKSALENSLKTITRLTKEKTSDFKIKKPEEPSWNWKPLHNGWATTTSKPTEVQANNPKNNKCRYNKKGFLEDDGRFNFDRRHGMG
nr:TPA: orf y [Tanacetum cinerariifolium]